MSSIGLQRHNAVQVVCLSTIGSPHGEKVRRWRHVQAVEEVFGHPIMNIIKLYMIDNINFKDNKLSASN